MLADAPRVYALLQAELDGAGAGAAAAPLADEEELREDEAFRVSEREEIEREEVERLERKRGVGLVAGGPSGPAQPLPETAAESGEEAEEDGDVEVRLFVLADTTYSACCVDEIAAEHVGADVVVHYGRACLSPSARGLPQLHVLVTRPLDVALAARTLAATFPDGEDKVVIVADAPYAAHVERVAAAAKALRSGSVFATKVVHDPAAWIPNRTAPREGGEDEAGTLKGYHVFHLGEPPTALLLTLASRVRSIRVYVPDDSAARATEEELEERLAAPQLRPEAQPEPQQQPTPPPKPEEPPTAAPAPQRATAHLLKRRYAVVTAASTATVFGVLINTLSTRDHLAVAAQARADIAAAGRKSYTFAVGKANPAKLANFAEVQAWVVVGCWESSLIDGKEFLAPLATPFELRLALTPVGRRVWDGAWAADFASVLAARDGPGWLGDEDGDGHDGCEDGADAGGWDGEGALPESAPPEYDLRTGRYVARAAPAVAAPATAAARGPQQGEAGEPRRELAIRARGDVARVGGVASPGAEFLRSQRTWQGLGSDFATGDRGGAVEGGQAAAEMEVGRTGVARGYVDGEQPEERR
jgi:diphthamide biosynthesis protein 2